MEDVIRLQFGCLPTAIGSMPHADPRQACQQVVSCLPSIPVWPQLPKRSFMENMYVQFSDGFPNLVLDRKGERIYVDRSADLAKGLEKLYGDSLENRSDDYAITADYAAGLHAFLGMKSGRPVAVKGQVTGPVSWGLTVTDQEHRSVLYDDTLADAVARHLRLKARWEERALAALGAPIIIFLDEPYLSSIGSAFTPVSRELVGKLIGEVLSGIEGIKGVHCCGNTDWSVLFDTPLDILSFDAYNYAQSLSLYTEGVKGLLDRGGSIAWGIVPNEEEALARESLNSLQDRLEEAMSPFTRKGVRFRQMVEQGLLTPSCGLASLSPEAARQALEFLADLSGRMRKRL
ncbi:MAG: Methionine synthase [Dehalococcoidia bacterium]|nr:Methionine synthase [Dehalococcoidia bacterium]